MSGFGRGLLMGSGNIWGTPTANDQALRAEFELLKERYRESEEDRLGWIAVDAGGRAVADALKAALREENPEHELVNDTEDGRNPARAALYYEALQKKKDELACQE